MSTAFWSDVPPYTSPQVQASGNSGGTYVNYFGATIPQVIGPTGTQRFRRQFTIGAALPPGILVSSFQGDIGANPPNVPPQLRLDGVLLGSGSSVNAGIVAFNSNLLTVGPHSLEIWVGQATIAGNTRLDIWTLNQFNGGICACCPTQITRCYTGGTVVGMMCGTFLAWFDSVTGALVSSPTFINCPSP